MALRIGELVGVLRADASAWERGLDRAQLRLAGLQRDTEGRLRDMNNNFREAGRISGRSLLRGIGSSLASLPGTIGRSVGKVAKNPYVLAALAAAGTTLGAAFVTAFSIALGGLAVVGVSYYILKDVPKVKKALDKMKKSIKDTFKDAAQPMAEPLADAFREVGDIIKDLKPQFKEMFQTVADSEILKNLTGGLKGFLEGFMPGFNDMLKDMKPVFEGLETLMGDIGEGLGGFFREIGKSAPEAKVFLEDLGGAIKKALIWTGKILAFLTKMYAKAQAAKDAVIILWNYFQTKAKAAWESVKATFWAVINWFKTLPERIWNGLTRFVKNIKLKFTQGKNAAIAAAKAMVLKAAHWIAGLPGRAWNALSDLGSNIASRAWDAGRRLVGAIRNKIGDAVRYVRGLPGRAMRALGNIGSKLYQSGRALIGGFIRGIWDRIGDVVNAAASVASRARDFFPFSPAKEGPFSGKGWTLYSGRALIDGFRAGIAQQLPALRRDLGGLPGIGMPGVGAAGGTARGPAAAASGGAMVIHLDIGGRDFGKLWVDTARKEVRVLGGDVQAAIGRKKKG